MTEQDQELTQLQALRTELTTTKKKVLQLQEQIKELEEDVYSKCKHEWKIDYTNVGEHTEYICTKCGGGPPSNDGSYTPKKPKVAQP